MPPPSSLLLKISLHRWSCPQPHLLPPSSLLSLGSLLALNLSLPPPPQPHPSQTPLLKQNQQPFSRYPPSQPCSSPVVSPGATWGHQPQSLTSSFQQIAWGGGSGSLTSQCSAPGLLRIAWVSMDGQTHFLPTGACVGRLQTGPDASDWLPTVSGSTLAYALPGLLPQCSPWLPQQQGTGA